MRVLLASQPLAAGVPRHVEDLVDGLRREGAAVTVACPPASQLWGALEGAPGVTLVPFTRHRGPHPADVVSLARLLRLARTVDVMHAHSSKAGVLVRVAALVTGRTRRCVFTPHGWSFWSASGAMARAYRLVERVAARWCAAILTVSAFERDAGLAAGVASAGRYEVVPNGVDLERFGAPARPVAGRLVFLARLAPPKAPELCVRAMPAVLHAHPHARLDVVGDGPLRAAAETLARDLGVEGAVRFLGDRDDVPEQLAGAAGLVLASGYEGCPLSVLEAMAAGVPVVVTRVGGIDEIVEDGVTGWIAEPTVAALAGSLVA
ncbi:MAG: glycosyltransferase, partial [Actinobacteria bacterium]|nr:glycosyltransferase [Actinomycetota bacterium]